MSRGGLGLASYISFGLERETPKGRRLLAFDFTMSRGLGLASYISFGLERETPKGRYSTTAPRSCPFACRGRLLRA